MGSPKLFTQRSGGELQSGASPWPKIEEMQTVMNRINSRVNYLQKVSDMFQENIREISKAVKSSLPNNENITLMDSN